MSVRNAGIKQASLGGTNDVLNNSSSFFQATKKDLLLLDQLYSTQN